MEEEVRSVLMDGKVLLQFALVSEIEAIRQNSDKYNNLLVSNTSSSATPQQSPLLHIEGYKDMLLDIANRLYDKLMKHSTNSINNNAAFNMTSLSSLPANLSSQANQSDNTYRKEDSEIAHISKDV